MSLFDLKDQKLKFFAAIRSAYSDLELWRAPANDFTELVNGTTLQNFVSSEARLIRSISKNAVLRLD